MYQYGNLMYTNSKGWVFVKEEEEVNLDTETLISSLDYLGKKKWEVVLYSNDIGYLLKKEK